MTKIRISDIPKLKKTNPKIYKEFRSYFKFDILDAKKYFNAMIAKYGIRNYKLSEFLSYCASWTIIIFDNDTKTNCTKYLFPNIEFSKFKKQFIKEVLKDEFFSLVYSYIKENKDENSLIPSSKLDYIKYKNFQIVDDLQNYIKSILIT